MRPSKEHHIIAVALRCYPARWRLRHGPEAAALASALLDDGVPWWSLTMNLLLGAARDRVVRKPSLRLATTLIAVMLGIAAMPLALFASLAPASASSARIVIIISKPTDAARQLKAAFSAHHFKLTVSEKSAPAMLVGSILSVSTTRSSTKHAINELHYACDGGVSRCVNGLAIPLHFSGVAHVTIGRAAVLRATRGH